MEEEEDLFVLYVSRDSPIGECYIISSTYKIEIVTFYKTYTVREGGMRLRSTIQSESRIHKRLMSKILALSLYDVVFPWCF